MKILITGDFCPRDRGTEQIELQKFEESFSELSQVMNSVDYRITNLECPVVVKLANPIAKMGPNLKCTPKVADALTYLNFNCLTLANNHIMDFGRQGLHDTIEFCKRHDFDYVGVGYTEDEASQTKFVNIAGKTLAIINCCEFEFSIALGEEAGANHLNPVRQYNAIKKAKENADYIVVIIHGGHEHWQLPSPRMVETYRFFVDAGADAVINHHQHCYSGYEVYKGNPIFYGLGNFYFDIDPIRKDDKWNYGYMVLLNFEESITFKILPYKQCADTPSISLLPQQAFNEKLMELNSIIENPELLKQNTNEYYDSCSKDSAIVFEPIQNRYFNGLQYRKLLPMFRTRMGLRLLYNFILCEAHRDKLQYYLTKKLNNQK